MYRSIAGNLLVASTGVEDALFSQAVCLVVQHDQEGAIGLLLNRPFHPQPANLLAMLDPKEAQPEGTSARFDIGDDSPVVPGGQSRAVHFGGPLSGPVVALQAVRKAELGGAEGLMIAAEKGEMETLLNDPDSPVRVIVGHAGWTAGQLEQEIAAGTWHIASPTTDVIFGDHQTMWGRLLRSACGNSVARWVGAPQIPNPELN
ncbi:hypothetical protein FF011L_47900 [Roseimaritima multifibrata]|uniref:Uncharacterized protein n=1 Tax=Roseimaritima multifibrata TaxID=1930274 RepID=A0A517MM65_9BACT|nr:YqgE/AlgH family protein [Roseimaritima multifibrata]QDS95986.1 hypothetical protein FF011L_47900 [Roseimaritima multifibrata]